MVPYYIIANHCDLFDGLHLTFRSGKLPQRTSWRPLQLSLNLNLSMIRLPTDGNMTTQQWIRQLLLAHMCTVIIRGGKS